MARQFNAFAPVVKSATLITFAAEDFSGPATVEVHIVGSSLSYDETTGAMSGTITSLELVDVTDSLTLQTVDIDLNLQATLAATASDFLGKVIAVKTQFDGWGFSGGAGQPVYNASGTTITITGAGGDTIVVTGHGFAQDTTLGTVTSVTHYAANHTTVLHALTGLPLPLSVVSTPFGADENFYGVLTQGDDTVTETNANVLSQSLDGGAGHDTIIGDPAGSAQVDYQNAAAAVTVNLATGVGTDALQHIAAVHGSAFNDTIIGNAGQNFLQGWFGNDTLNGGSGADTISGGLGRDIMTGGSGHDVFDFDFINETGKTAATRDKITDFKHGQDDINVHDIDASTKSAGNQNFKFIGVAKFHHKAGELHYVKQDLKGTAHDKTIVEGDTNGDGKADFQIELSHLKILTAGDFIL